MSRSIPTRRSAGSASHSTEIPARRWSSTLAPNRSVVRPRSVARSRCRRSSHTRRSRRHDSSDRRASDPRAPGTARVGPGRPVHPARARLLRPPRECRRGSLITWNRLLQPFLHQNRRRRGDDRPDPGADQADSALDQRRDDQVRRHRQDQEDGPHDRPIARELIPDTNCHPGRVGQRAIRARLAPPDLRSVARLRASSPDAPSRRCRR